MELTKECKNMKINKYKIIFLIILITYSNQTFISNAINEDQINNDFIFTWKRLLSLNVRENDILSLISSLNRCIELIKIGDEDNLKEANNIIVEVNAKMNILENYQEEMRFNQQVSIGIILMIIILFVILILTYGSKIYWTFWYNQRKKWRIKID